MNTVIYKYPIHPGTQSLYLPEGAVILTAQEQHGQLCLWAQVNPECATVAVIIYVIGTGEPTPVDFNTVEYVSTAQMGNGLVWHVFRRRFLPL